MFSSRRDSELSLSAKRAREREVIVSENVVCALSDASSSRQEAGVGRMAVGPLVSGARPGPLPCVQGLPWVYTPNPHWQKSY